MGRNTSALFTLSMSSIGKRPEGESKSLIILMLVNMDSRLPPKRWRSTCELGKTRNTRNTRKSGTKCRAREKGHEVWAEPHPGAGFGGSALFGARGITPHPIEWSFRQQVPLRIHLRHDKFFRRISSRPEENGNAVRRDGRR